LERIREETKGLLLDGALAGVRVNGLVVVRLLILLRNSVRAEKTRQKDRQR